MGITFSELFYFYFQRAKKRKRKQGGGGIVVKLFIYFFYVNSFLYILFFYVNSFLYSFLPSSLLNARFHFHLIHPHLIIQCKVSFSSHFIPWGGFCCKYLNK